VAADRVFDEWLPEPVCGMALRLVVEQMSDGAPAAAAAGATLEIEPTARPSTTWSSGTGWPWRAAAADPCPAVTWTVQRESTFRSLRIPQPEGAPWIRRYRLEVSADGAAWRVAVPSRRLDPRHRQPVNLPFAPTQLESSRLDAGGGTAMVRSFFDDFFLRAIERLGPDSPYPDCLTAPYFLSAATEPFAFAGCYNPGDSANFNSLLAAILSPPVAAATEQLLVDQVARFGFLPSLFSPGKDDRAFGLDISGINWPPSCYRDVWGWLCDRTALARFADSCETWARWVLEHRDPDRDGWLELGMNGCRPAPEAWRREQALRNVEIAQRSPDFWDHVCRVNGGQSAFQAAIYELATDDYPIYVSGRHKGVRFDPVTCTLSIHYLDTQMFMLFLAGFIAWAKRETGRGAEAAAWDETAGRFRDLVAGHHWDTDTGFYYDLDGDTGRRRTHVKHVAGFYPLVAGIPTVPQAERMVSHLLDEGEFWSAFPVSSMERRAADFQPFGYWSGRTWPPFNLLVLRGLLNYGFFDVADRLLGRWMAHVGLCRERGGARPSTRRQEGFAVYDARGVVTPDVEWIVPENWNCDTGEVHGAGALTWGGSWITAVIMRNFWPLDEHRALVRPGGSLRLDWSGRWDVEVDGNRARVNGRGYGLEPNTTYLVDTATGSSTPLAPGRADSSLL
jgi:hypothetical protein